MYNFANFKFFFAYESQKELSVSNCEVQNNCEWFLVPDFFCQQIDVSYCKSHAYCLIIWNRKKKNSYYNATESVNI